MHTDSKLLCLASIWSVHIGTTRSVCCVVCNGDFTFCVSVENNQSLTHSFPRSARYTFYSNIYTTYSTTKPEMAS